MVRPAQWWCLKLLFKGAKVHQTAGVTMTLGLKGVTKSDCMLEHLDKSLVLVDNLSAVKIQRIETISRKLKI